MQKFTMFIIFFVAILFWITWSFLRVILPYLSNFIDWKIEKLGQWGDSFGALNTLFSAFGFSAVIITLILQQKQNKVTRDEQHKQRFESSYFQLLSFLRESREEVRFQHSPDYKSAKNKTNISIETSHSAFKAAWEEAAYWLELKSTPPWTKNTVEIYTTLMFINGMKILSAPTFA